MMRPMKWAADGLALLSAATILLTSAPALGAGFQQVAPEEVGLSSERLERLTAALEAKVRDGTIPADPAVVLSNVPGAAGLELAGKLGVPTEVVDHREIKPRATHEGRVIELLRTHRVDLVCLAGYMRLLSPLFVSAYRDRIFNIHPSLLPAFPGLHVQRKAIEYGVRFSGCTVHFVVPEVDAGPIVLQAAVPIEQDDTEATLAARILEQEHVLYPQAGALFFEGIRLDGRRAVAAKTKA